MTAFPTHPARIRIQPTRIDLILDRCHGERRRILRRLAGAELGRYLGMGGDAFEVGVAKRGDKCRE